MAEILGPDGRPLRARDRELRERVARASLVGLRSAGQWRQVLATLTPEALGALLRRVATGAWAPDWLELCAEVEERDPHYGAVLQQRRLGAAALPAEVAPASDEAPDVALADEVRAALVETPGWAGLVSDLLDAVGKGIALVEVVWSRTGGRWTPAGYHWIDPRWVAFADDGETPLLIRGDGAAPRGPGPSASRTGVPADALPPAKFVYHRHRARSGILALRGGLSYAVAGFFLLKSQAIRDWWAYGAVYGLPVRLGYFDPETATEDDVRLLEAALGALASDFAAALPENMRIDFMRAGGTGAGAGGGGGDLFANQVAMVDAQISKAVLGQTMTTEDGSSRSQAEVHLAVRDELLADDARQLYAALSEQLVAWYCGLNHPPRPAGWPRVRVREPEDVAAVERAVAASERIGLPLPARWLRARLGVPEPEPGEEVLAGRAGPGGGPAAPGASLNAAETGDPEGPLRTGWQALSDQLAAPAVRALRDAGSADEFAARALAGDDSAARLVGDLALSTWMARVEGDVGP